MKIGIIVGKSSEEFLTEGVELNVPKKYMVDGVVQTDVAIAYTIKRRYTDIDVDIILPKDISLQRLKKNDINYIMGYDYISALNDAPYVAKFSGKGADKIDKMYENPNSKVFPSYSFLDFIWNKQKYLEKLQKNGVRINPTIFLKRNTNVKKLIQQIQKYKWDQFIIKPNGGTEGLGLGKFSLKKVLSDPSELQEYFDANEDLYNGFLVQNKLKGFYQYGEVKSYWFDGKFSYAVNINDKNTDPEVMYDDKYHVREIIDEDILKECKRIGEKVMKIIPKISFNKKRVLPTMVRIDFGCCIDNKATKAPNFFVNEIEHQDACPYVHFPNVKYPYVEVMADTMVKKCQELKLN
tara:strand:- start:4 stop:1056 length:1053 start_codon:yes stop_codon:yes gene_type:complete